MTLRARLRRLAETITLAGTTPTDGPCDVCAGPHLPGVHPGGPLAAPTDRNPA